MIDLLIWAVLVVGYIFTYRKVYPVMADMDGGGDEVERALFAVMALLICLIWPVVIVGYVVWRLITPVTPLQREQELREREKRIAELERINGIGRKKR